MFQIKQFISSWLKFIKKSLWFRAKRISILRITTEGESFVQDFGNMLRTSLATSVICPTVVRCRMAEIQTDSETVAAPELLYKSEEPVWGGPADDGGAVVPRLGDSEELLLPGETEAG